VSGQPDLDRLGRVLSVAPDRLAGLGALSAHDLDALTFQVSDALYAEDAERLLPLLALIDRIPAPLAASMAEHALPPRLIARLAPHLDDRIAAGVIERLSPGCLAEVAAWLEHGRCAGLLARIEPWQIAEAARYLAQDGRWETMAAIASELPDRSLAAALAALDDSEVRRTLAAGDPATVRRVLAGLEGRRRARVLGDAGASPDPVAA
jgi:hypothetical protein